MHILSYHLETGKIRVRKAVSPHKYLRLKRGLGYKYTAPRIDEGLTDLSPPPLSAQEL